MATNFNPQDYSRFLIREFLKRNGFDKTYDQFMAEDTRPKVSMTKNELTKLLGIDQLLKRNTKTKQFDTMLDIICDFLMLERISNGGVKLTAQNELPKPVKQLNESTNNDQKTEPQVKKQTTQKRTASMHQKLPTTTAQNNVSKTQQNWFEKQPTQKNQEPIDDDWDIEDNQNAVEMKNPYIKMKPKVQPQQQSPTKNQQDGWLPPQQTQQQKTNIPIVKKKVPVKKEQEGLDELDDLMGFGGGNANDSYSNKQNKKEDQMRDTLGFLKKSEQEKKQREEQKKQGKLDQDQQYKQLSEVKTQLNGYDKELIFDYNMAQLPSNTRQMLKTQYREEIISQQESNQIRKLLFKNPNSNFHDSWHQGFFFDQKIKYGIYQKEGGPCGILATVQAFFLKHLLFISKTNLTQVNQDKRENYIAAAITDILINSSDERKGLINIVIPTQNPRQPIIPTQCMKLILKNHDPLTIFNVIKDNIGYFISAEGHGVILLVYSVILTKGIDNIIGDMDIKDNALLTEHGYASQELINIMLVGQAASNVFDGDKDMGDDFVLRGIYTQSEIGFLTLFEAYGYFQVGNFLKNPKLPIWIICSESHYSVIFSPDFSLTQKRQQTFDLIYYDELARQEDDIILTVKLGMYKGPVNLQETTEMIPPIDAVIRTKWDHGLVSWNGRQAIL